MAELREIPKELIWETKFKVPMESDLKVKREVWVFMKRGIRFAKKASEDSVCDNAASLDEHHAVTTMECDEDPGVGGLTTAPVRMWMPARMPASQQASLCVMRKSLIWLTVKIS